MKRLSILFFCLFSVLFTFAQTDGPYILYENNGLRMISFDETGKLNDTFYPEKPDSFSFEVKSQKGKHTFKVNLHPFSRPEWKVKQAGKVFITSDPHGDLNSFVEILKAGKVIDENFNWIFGNNQLVIIGDIFDRGKDVLPLFWLVYKLEDEAGRVGGSVYFLLGNHEEMVMRGDLRYTDKMYLEIAAKIGIPIQNLWHENSELGRWLQTRNTMQIIGDNLFVHAGLSEEFLIKNLSIPDVNETMSANLFRTKEGRAESELAAFLFGSYGPLWYRGMVRTEESYKPVSWQQVDLILKKYGVKRIYVGHTIFTEIWGTYADHVIDVNVDNKENREDKRARAILINENKIYSVYDSGALLEKIK